MKILARSMLEHQGAVTYPQAMAQKKVRSLSQCLNWDAKYNRFGFQAPVEDICEVLAAYVNYYDFTNSFALAAQQNQRHCRLNDSLIGAGHLGLVDKGIHGSESKKGAPLSPDDLGSLNWHLQPERK